MKNLYPIVHISSFHLWKNRLKINQFLTFASKITENESSFQWEVRDKAFFPIQLEIMISPNFDNIFLDQLPALPVRTESNSQKFK